MADFEGYLANAGALLEAEGPDMFAPNLAAVDRLIASLQLP